MERVPGSACNDALGVNRVALLFLMRGEAYHDVLWRRWLDSAAGLLPAQALQARVHGGWPRVCVWVSCMTQQRQHLGLCISVGSLTTPFVSLLLSCATLCARLEEIQKIDRGIRFARGP